MISLLVVRNVLADAAFAGLTLTAASHDVWADRSELFAQIHSLGGMPCDEFQGNSPPDRQPQGSRLSSVIRPPCSAR